MNQPIIIAISLEQFNALEKLQVEFADLKQDVALLKNKPQVEWVTKAYLQKHKTLGVSGFAGVDAKLKALVAEKHIRQQGKTYNLLDILAFNLKTQAA